MARELTRKQQLFVVEYIKSGDGRKSAIAAGYSPQTADSQASQLLKNPKVSKVISKKTEQLLNKLDISAEKVLQEIAKLGFSNMLDYMGVTPDGDAYVNLSGLTRDQAAAIQEITVDEYTEGRGEEARNVKRTKFKLGDKRGSLELLGRHLKLFTDKTEITGKDGAPLVADVDARLAELLAEAAERAKSTS